MTSNGRQETAKIYQFPVNPRTAGGRPVQERSTSASLPRAAFEIGAAWYHDAAIAAAKPDCPNAG